MPPGPLRKPLQAEPLAQPTPRFGSWRAYISIARPDHWVKNVFLLPGVVLPLSIPSLTVQPGLAIRLVVGTIALCLITSSNYVLNEILDARTDLAHELKRYRPIPSGQVRVPFAYLEWVMLAIVGLALGFAISTKLGATLGILWIMGLIYNVPPIRSKDVPYLDVLSEAVNNPLRMIAGWYMVVDQLVPTLSLLLSYWMIGCYFMALKRFSELREIGDPTVAAAYRQSFLHYTERSLLGSVVFYAAASMLFLGAFIARYRLELILAFPFVALMMAVYFSLAFEPNSAAQHPEKLYREKKLVGILVLAAVAMLTLLFVDLPWLRAWFAPIYQ